MTHTITELPEALDANQLISPSPSPRPEDFRLMRVQPEQMEAAWPSIKQSLVGAMPIRIPEAESTFQVILAAINARGVVPWIIRTDKDIFAIMTTVKKYDEITEHAFLMIFTLYAMPGMVMPLRVWVDCFAKLSVYAREIGCESVILETRSEEVAHLAKRIHPGADIETRIINMPLVEED